MPGVSTTAGAFEKLGWRGVPLEQHAQHGLDVLLAPSFQKRKLEPAPQSWAVSFGMERERGPIFSILR